MINLGIPSPPLPLALALLVAVVKFQAATLVTISRECQDKNDGESNEKFRKDVNQVNLSYICTECILGY